MTAPSMPEVKGIHLVTPIPGPKSRELLDRRTAAVPRGVGHATPLAMQRGCGALVEDVDGNWYIDLAGGIGVMNVGYADPVVDAAIRKQLDLFTHSCFQVIGHEPYIALAEALNRLTPGKFAKKTMLLNSGAEAVENAVKIARAATGRPAVIAFEHGFHGRTLLGMTLTSKTAYKQGFGPFAPEVYRAPYPRSVDDLDTFERLFKTHVDARDVAAILIEPVLGEGGFLSPPEGFWSRLRTLCDNHGIVLVADEVQSGFARTGTLFAMEQTGVDADLIVSAKSLAGGMPLGAVTGKAALMDAAAPGGLGSTFGGNAVACAAALATIQRIEELDLCGRAVAIGNTVRARFEALKVEVPAIADVRGPGAMVGVELARLDATGKRIPATQEVAALQKYAYEHGVLTVTAGTHANVLRTLMPLVITDAQLSQALQVLEDGLRAIFI
jgi:4-aminobutyrate aminotransferase/(S)-3-amino-2-methylpropionate transaminase